MTATAHAILGGAIASSVPDPLLGITLAAISHPLFDLVPHWDVGRGWKKKSKTKLFIESSFDFGLGIILAFLIFGQNTNYLYLLSAIFAANLLDLATVPYLIFKWKFFPFPLIFKIQDKWQGKANLPWGIITQIAVVFVAIILAKFL